MQLFVCIFLTGLTVLPSAPKIYPLFFLRQNTPQTHYQSYHCLPSLKNSDISYIFYLCILQFIFCCYFFPFLLKFITQSPQDKLISFVLTSVSTIFLAINCLMYKPSIYFPLSHLSLTRPPPAPDFLFPPCYEYQPCQSIHLSYSMTCLQTSRNSIYLYRSTLLFSINKDVGLKNTHS